MKHIKSVLLFALVANTILATAAEPKIKNVIFMIGDGMGLAQIYSGITASPGQLSIEQFPYVGISKTYSADNYITDSAAGGTALACGEKTKNGMIGVAPDGTAINSTLYVLAQQGWSTGVIATSSITDATPASFVAHQPSRKMQEEIAEDFLKNTPDVFIGGGRKYFEQRKDGRNLLSELRGKGYDVVSNIQEMKSSTSSKLTALLAEDGMPSVQNGRGEMLAEATEKAINILKNNKKGFFLMVEGSQIDWQAHANNKEGVVAEMKDFDKAIAEALEFARKDGHTLVIVTADHETGGMVLRGGSIDNHYVDAGFMLSGHSALPVMVFAYGPGAENFSGIMQNTSMKGKILDLLKIQE